LSEKSYTCAPARSTIIGMMLPPMSCTEPASPASILTASSSASVVKT